MEHITRQELFKLLGCPLGAPPAHLTVAPATLQDAETAIAEKYSSPSENEELEGSLSAEALAEEAPASSPEGVQSVAESQCGPIADYKPSREGAAPSRVRNEAAHVRYLLNTAVPRLWRYTLANNPDLPVRQQRSKLRELLAWLFTKEGYTVTAGAPAPYRAKGELISGHIDLLVSAAPGKPLLALETDWIREAASVLKLAYWHEKGLCTVWVLGSEAASEEPNSFREFADRIYGRSTARWLSLLPLKSPPRS